MRPLAILCSDLHFSAIAPAARSAEPDWYLAQKRYIDQLKALQKVNGDCPIIVAGDLYDRWTPVGSPAELINFLLAELPDKMFVIPGQHDLKNHRYETIESTPYWTLVMAGKIINIPPRRDVLQLGFQVLGDSRSGLYAHAFPWGYEVKPYDGPKQTGDIHIAVVHAYIWGKDFGGYPGAPEDRRVESYLSKLEGYDAAVFGDNHEGRLINSRLINCGTFLRRKSDERHYRPMVGILYEDAHIEVHYLDVSADLWLDDAPSKAKEDQAADTSGIVESLRKLGVDALDFRAMVRHLMDQQQTGERVRQVVAGVVP